MLKRDIVAKLREAKIHNDWDISFGQAPYDITVYYQAPEPRSVDPGGWFVARIGYKFKESTHWTDHGAMRFTSLSGGEDAAWAFVEKRLKLKREDFVRSPFAKGSAKDFVHKEALRRALERAGIAA